MLQRCAPQTSKRKKRILNTELKCGAEWSFVKRFVIWGWGEVTVVIRTVQRMHTDATIHMKNCLSFNHIYKTKSYSHISSHLWSRAEIRRIRDVWFILPAVPEGRGFTTSEQQHQNQVRLIDFRYRHPVWQTPPVWHRRGWKQTHLQCVDQELEHTEASHRKEWVFELRSKKKGYWKPFSRVPRWQILKLYSDKHVWIHSKRRQATEDEKYI